MDLIGGWAAHMRLSGKAPTTVRSRTRTLRRVARDVGPLDTLTRRDLEAWLAAFEKPSTRFTNLSYVRCFYRWALDEELVQTDPTARIPAVKVPRRLPRPIATDELTAALEAAPPRTRIWMELMAYAGLRVSEVAACHPQRHLNAGNDGAWWLDIPVAKGGSFQTVYLPTWLAWKLRDTPPWSITGQTVNHDVTKVLRAIGSQATPHQLRHWFGTTLAQTSSAFTVQRQMRHASMSTTAGYVQVQARVLVDAAEGLPRIA